MLASPSELEHIFYFAKECTMLAKCLTTIVNVTPNFSRLCRFRHDIFFTNVLIIAILLQRFSITFITNVPHSLLKFKSFFVPQLDHFSSNLQANWLQHNQDQGQVLEKINHSIQP